MTLVVLAVVVGALAQSVSGIGFTLVCGPLLVAALGPADGVRLSVVLSLVVNAVVLARTWRSVSWRDTVLLLVPAVLATPVLARLLRTAPERAAEVLAGAATLLGALLVAAGLRWRAAGGRAGAVATGVVSAAMNVVAGAGGPAVAVFAANAGWPAAGLRSTAQAYFLVLNLVAALSLGLPRVAGALVLGCLAAVAVGLVLGGPLAARVPETAARRVTLALAATGGLALLVGV